MNTHAPIGYECPLCLIAASESVPGRSSPLSDLVYKDEKVKSVISDHQWPNNPGDAIVFPIEHFENIYELPDEFAIPTQRLVNKITIEMKKAWVCDGTSTRQHNEPAGSQDVWHYHVHVTPRYEGDQFYATYANSPSLMEPNTRAKPAAQLRSAMAI